MIHMRTTSYLYLHGLFRVEHDNITMITCPQTYFGDRKERDWSKVSPSAQKSGDGKRKREAVGSMPTFSNVIHGVGSHPFIEAESQDPLPQYLQ